MTGLVGWAPAAQIMPGQCFQKLVGFDAFVVSCVLDGLAVQADSVQDGFGPCGICVFGEPVLAERVNEHDAPVAGVRCDGETVSPFRGAGHDDRTGRFPPPFATGQLDTFRHHIARGY